MSEKRDPLNLNELFDKSFSLTGMTAFVIFSALF